MRATEAANLLRSCLRFAHPAGGTVDFDHRSVDPVTGMDDRTPVELVFPPDLRFSSGPNRIWNTIMTLPYCDEELIEMTAQRNEAISHLRALLDTPLVAGELSKPWVAAREWLTNLEGIYGESEEEG